MQIAHESYQKRVREIGNLDLDADTRENALKNAAEEYDAAVEQIKSPYAQYEQSSGKTR